MRDAMNMNTRSDRRTLARAVSAGWQLTDEQVGRYARALDVALGHALKKGDQRAIISCVRTMATIVGQVQADEHLQQRLDAGQLTDQQVTIRVIRGDE